MTAQFSPYDRQRGFKVMLYPSPEFFVFSKEAFFLLLRLTFNIRYEKVGIGTDIVINPRGDFGFLLGWGVSLSSWYLGQFLQIDAEYPIGIQVQVISELMRVF